MTEDPGARRGVVTRLDDGRQRLEFRRSWSAPVEDVWSALTRPDRLARWIGRYDGARGPGGTGTFFMTHEEGEHTGEPMTILECAPPGRLVVVWTQPEAADWRVDLDLWNEDGRTHLSFAQVFGADADVTDYALGWHWYLEKFGAEVAGTPAPGEWEAFLARTGAAYGRG